MGIRYVFVCKDHNKHHVKNHLCQIILERDFDRIKKLVKDTKYFCKNCGRAAHDKGNLCNPSKI